MTTPETVCWKCQSLKDPSERFCGKCGNQIRQINSIIIQGQYQLVKSLGGGTYGKVYLALDKNMSDRACALKVMHLDEGESIPEEYRDQCQKDPELRRRIIEHIRRAVTESFEKEADTLAHLDHPNIVRIYSKFTEGNRHYLVEEYVRGNTLRAILNTSGGALKQDQVIDLAVEILGALEFMHVQPEPVIHRDLKPENVMVNARGNTWDVKLVDFGIARLFKPAKPRDTAFGGTHGYAPPEQMANEKPRTDARSDLYSVGVLMHEALSGLDPTLNLYQFAPLRSVDPDLASAVAKAVEKDPARRFQGAREFAEKLREIQQKAIRAAAPRQITPFEFANATYSTKQDLAAALARNWSQAIERLASGEIGWWLRYTLGDKQAATAIEGLGKIEYPTHPIASVILFKTITLLNPQLQPRFRSQYDLTPPAIAKQCGEWPSDVLDILYEYRLLEWYGQTTGHQEYKGLDSLWRRYVEDFERMKRSVLRGGAPSTQVERVPYGKDILLLAAVVPEVVEGLRKRAFEAGAAAAFARASKWFALLGDPETAGPGRLLLMMSLSHDAERETKDSLKRKKNEARKALIAQRERDDLYSESSLESARLWRRTLLSICICDLLISVLASSGAWLSLIFTVSLGFWLLYKIGSLLHHRSNSYFVALAQARARDLMVKTLFRFLPARLQQLTGAQKLRVLEFTVYGSYLTCAVLLSTQVIPTPIRLAIDFVLLGCAFIFLPLWWLNDKIPQKYKAALLRFFGIGPSVRTYEINCVGYWTSSSLDRFPTVAGLYFVYACEIVHGTAPIKLLYIGEADNLRYDIRHSPEWDFWRADLDDGQDLSFALAALLAGQDDRSRVASALIHSVKPPCNVGFEERFSFPKTEVNMSGRWKFDVNRFTVYQGTAG